MGEESEVRRTLRRPYAVRNARERTLEPALVDRGNSRRIVYLAAGGYPSAQTRVYQVDTPSSWFTSPIPARLPGRGPPRARTPPLCPSFYLDAPFHIRGEACLARLAGRRTRQALSLQNQQKIRPSPVCKVCGLLGKKTARGRPRLETARGYAAATIPN